MNEILSSMTRRRFLRSSAILGACAGLNRLLPAYALQPAQTSSAHGKHNTADAINLVIGEERIPIAGRHAKATTINGTVPGPLVRLREGQNAVLRVTNHLKEDTSIHWHGLILPYTMDGVPGVSFAGIKPGETFTYRFPVTQSGTYWYHSHSGLQEQTGVYGPLIIDPATPEPFQYDREYVVVLSDWTFENPYWILSRLKKEAGYFNFQKRTLKEFIRDTRDNGLKATLADRMMWSRMRMDPTDIADITGATYHFLLNGLSPEANWTALFQPGERVRLRFINAAAGTYFDARIPGLPMTVVQADGQNVQPVTVDEFRIAIAETFDVIVEPKEDRAFTLFAETMDRSGYARGTLAPSAGMSAELPERRERPLLTMADMGLGDEHGAHGDAAPNPGTHESHSGPMKEQPASASHAEHGAMAGMDKMSAASGGVLHGPDHHGPGNSMVAMMSKSRLHEPGNGLENMPWRVLAYTDLRSLAPWPDPRPPSREIELHLTGNMEKYIWGFDGKKYPEAPEPIRFYHGERLRLTLVNDTMMDHPIHLHGMWMELDNGAGPLKPRKHTINVKPAERLSLDITADAPGNWAFHCHILYHMETGMFRVVAVSKPEPA
jgi:CopA family copper-resistance protein